MLVDGADSKLIRKSQDKAAREQTTLNELFSGWIKHYVNADIRGRNLMR